MKTYNHPVKGLDAVADAFAGTVYSDVVSMKNNNHCQFIIHKAVGATGTSTVTVEACDDFVPTTTEAITFRYQTIISGDTAGAETKATVAGFTTTAGSSQLYKIEVDAEALASLGYPSVRLKMVEVVNSPVLGGIIINLTEPRVDTPIQDTAIV